MWIKCYLHGVISRHVEGLVFKYLVIKQQVIARKANNILTSEDVWLLNLNTMKRFNHLNQSLLKFFLSYISFNLKDFQQLKVSDNTSSKKAVQLFSNNWELI